MLERVDKQSEVASAITPLLPRIGNLIMPMLINKRFKNILEVHSGYFVPTNVVCVKAVILQYYNTYTLIIIYYQTTQTQAIFSTKFHTNVSSSDRKVIKFTKYEIISNMSRA